MRWRQGWRQWLALASGRRNIASLLPCLIMSISNVQCAFILLFSCFLVVATVDVTCPQKGIDLSCRCKDPFDNNILHVECSNTNIKDIPSWLPSNTNVLNFERCDIRSLSNESFQNLPNLTSVTISNQQWLTVNDGLVFQGLRRLIEVYLESNHMSSLPAGLFANLPTLIRVSVRGNPLPTLPDDLFQNSTNVESLDIRSTQLNRNIITKIGQGHFGTSITELLMSGTRIQILFNEFFNGLPNLRDLATVSCGIESIGEDILKGTDVLVVYLNENPIQNINENAFRYSKVTQFLCEGCQLTSDVAFNGFLKKMDLDRINLKNNNLTSISQNAFEGLNNLDHLELSLNPLICDCDLVWLRSFTENNIKYGDKDSWMCDQPSNLSGKRFLSLKASEICDMPARSKPTAKTQSTAESTSDGTFCFISTMTLIFAVICYVTTDSI